MNEQRALLLTDLVDSTQLVERLGDAAAAELGAAHDRLARDLLRRWHGREIDKTDGMLMLFDSAADAVACALAYHAALAALPVPLKARAGLHVGPVVLRSNPPEDVAQGAKPLEVDGIAKPLAARVMSLALGGQTLLTADARAALGDTSLRTQSHGHWRIKGVAEPVELFEVGGASAPFVPPPDSAKVYRVVHRDDVWLPVRQIGHSLPAERDAFVGRQDALAELARRFEGGARLVSVLGIGGTGKTRLVTRFAWTWLGDFPGGAWFCDLSAARDRDGIAHAVALGLDVPLGVDDPVVQLGHAIAGRGPCLVILDNFEQVTRHAKDTLGCWLDRAAQARFLVTTREVLGLSGEEALALAPLGPSDAQALFGQRAASARRDYEPGADDQAAIPQLVKLLDGLPLAIELAAARVRVMAPTALLARMNQRFKVLVAAGGRQDRQATLRAAFDWSWDLLSEAEKAVLAQLSVFEGGFTLDAAEAVIEVPAGAATAPAVDLLQSLVDKSFVRPLGSTRFDLLGSVQEYAAEHLCTPDRWAGSGQAALRSAQRRHGRHYAATRDRQGGRDAGADIDNVVAACRRATARGEPDAAVATLDAAWLLLKTLGPFGVAVELSTAVFALAGLSDGDRALASFVSGSALNACGHVDAARARLEDGLAHARAAAHRSAEARLLIGLGELHGDQARSEESMANLRAALSLAEAIDDRSLQCEALNGLATACVDLGRLDEARTHYATAVRLARDSGDKHWEGGSLGNLGTLLFYEGHLDEASQHLGAGLVVARALGNRIWEGNALCNLGALHHAQGRLTEAMDESLAALRVARELGHVRLESTALCNLGLVDFALEHWRQAQTWYESALDRARELGDLRSEGLFLGYLGQVHARQQCFDEARACVSHGERLLQQAADPLSLGLLVCHRVEVEWLSGSHAEATQSMMEARETARKLGCGPASELGLALDRVSRMLHEQQTMVAR